MAYIEGFLAAVPTANREAYRAHAAQAAGAFRDRGALQVMECWGVEVPEGKVTSMPMAVQRGANETVVFGWVVWPSRAVRDRAMADFVSDPRVDPATNPMPFDGERLIYGGFETLVEG